MVDAHDPALRSTCLANQKQAYATAAVTVLAAAIHQGQASIPINGVSLQSLTFSFTSPLDEI